MKTIAPPRSLVLAGLFALTLAGCAGSSTPDEARAPSAARDVNRTVAIQSARQDASRSYGDGWITAVNAQYLAGYWVVELRAASGGGIRYAISARDGSIRERNVFQ